MAETTAIKPSFQRIISGLLLGWLMAAVVSTIMSFTIDAAGTNIFSKVMIPYSLQELFQSEGAVLILPRSFIYFLLFWGDWLQVHALPMLVGGGTP